MSFEITGRLVAVYDTLQRTETFKTREFVIEKSDDLGGRIITNYIKFQCVQDRTNLPDGKSLGDEVKVYFNLRGTKWVKDGKENYFTNLDAWRIEQIKIGTTEPSDMPPAYTPQAAPTEPVDDLPF